MILQIAACGAIAFAPPVRNVAPPLGRAAARLLRGDLPPTASSPALCSLSSIFCGLPADDGPTAPEGLPADDKSTASEDAKPWKAVEAEILRDIKPVVKVVKDILHSDSYEDGEFLSPDDEKVVVEKLLAYHPHSKLKIGCGRDAIMVDNDKHPEFKKSRCLYVVRKDGGSEDFSYRKCLHGYIRETYPSHADRFINKYLLRRPK